MVLSFKILINTKDVEQREQETIVRQIVTKIKHELDQKPELKIRGYDFHCYLHNLPDAVITNRIQIFTRNKNEVKKYISEFEKTLDFTAADWTE